MIDDFRLLGIAETRDPKAVKDAFRAKAKELHPDLVGASEGEDPIKRHFLFIAVTQAYHRVLARIKTERSVVPDPEAGEARGDTVTEAARRAGAAAGGAPRDAAGVSGATAGAPGSGGASGAARGPASAKPRPDGGAIGRGARSAAAASKGGALAPHRDPAYVLYKTGMRFYMAIHPSAWDLEPNLLSDAISSDDRKDLEMRKRVQELVRLFPKAYYYFSLVATDHPESPWAPDALEKMEIIERRSLRYKKIVESFGAWRRAGRERGREVRGIVDRTKRILEDEGGELRWPEGGGRDPKR